MKKLSVIAGFLAVVVVAAVAIAGVTEPILLLGGEIKNGTVPVTTTYGQYDFFCYADVLDGIRIVPRHWANKPVAEGTVPTARDGLLNPDKPVGVYLFGNDPMTFHLDYYQYNGADGRLKMRVMDSNGKTLGIVTEKTNPEGKLTLKQSNKKQRYYVEIYDPTRTQENYCYLLVEAERGTPARTQIHQPSLKTAPEISLGVPQTSQTPQNSKAMSNKSPQEMMKFAEELENYMKQNKIRDDALSFKDMQTVIDRTNKSLGYKAFDMKDFVSGSGQQQNTPKSTTTKTKRTKKSK